MTPNINDLVAQNLKRLREQKRISLDALSRLSGVSKSMLGQIERGEVNPTVSTVWKIASGLKVPFTELIDAPQADMEIIQAGDLSTLTEDGGRYRNRPIFPFDSTCRFETYRIEIDPQGHLEAAPHPAGVQEFITVFSGAVTITSGERTVSLEEGDSVRFRADRPHAYRNEGTSTCLLHMLLYYPQP